MSTRSHVIIVDSKGSKKYVYHHHDGYPEGVGAELDEVFNNSNFRNAIDAVNALVDYDDSYEPDSGIHSDEEYLYKVDIAAKTITCYDVNAKGWTDACDELMTPEYEVYTHNMMKTNAEKLRERLKDGIAYFSYRKTNGEIRQAKGTLNSSVSEGLANYSASGTRAIPNGVITYWDLDKDAWRTLKEENILEIY